MEQENVVVKQSCHSRFCRPQDSGIYNACRYPKKEKALLNKCVEDPRLQISGMTILLDTPSSALRASSPSRGEEKLAICAKHPSRGEVNGGFTLIELLVVVLIIGILAAVAVPQYQKAVEKSKAAQVLPLLKTIQQAYDAYYIANGTYPTMWEQLDASIPWTGNTEYIGPAPSWPVKSNEEWSMQLSTYGNRAIWLGRISGPYMGAGFAVFYTRPNDEKVPTKQIVCVEGSSANSVIKPFTKTKGDYCIKLFAAKEVRNGSANRYFTLK